jgi:DNA-binding NtrC family response regulator
MQPVAPADRVRFEPSVLIVDDDPAAVEFLRTVIAQSPRTPRFRVTTANSGFRAEQACRLHQPAVVLLDLVLPDADGIDVLRALKAIDQGLEVIIISGQGTLKRAVEAGQAGAFYFIDKSDLDPKGLLGLVDRAADLVHERRQHAWLQERVRDQHSYESILGKSKAMRAMFELVDAVAVSDANVLIQGENGTGKELFANAMHQRSQRASGPFIKINCAALPKDLIESELFGYKKGAFTGANTDKVGLLELARGGSLMLDEIGEMPAMLQTKLLRVLQEREFRPIGSDRWVQVDFRLICATNVDIEAALADGRLREDLYFRINTITLKVPPLRERAEDIPLLCSHFLEKFTKRYQKSITAISPAAYQLLMRFRWPGNVRELENAIERSVLVAKGREIMPSDLPESMREDTGTTAFTVPPHHTLADIERLAILQTLQRTNWNKQEAANLLGLYRPTLYSKMRRHQIRDPRAIAAEAASEADAE